MPPRLPDSDPPDCDDGCSREDRIVALETGLRDVIDAIGRPPDPSRNTAGTGIAGTVSQIATDVRELRSRGEWPSRALKALAAVLAVAVPLSAAVAWAASHLRYAP